MVSVGRVCSIVVVVSEEKFNIIDEMLVFMRNCDYICDVTYKLLNHDGDIL